MSGRRLSLPTIRWKLRAVIAVAIAIVACVAGWRMQGRIVYPYGFSHSCDTALFLDLRNYASQHDGNFPFGEATPEASLSLLAESPYHADAELLRGKSVALDVVKPILERGERLGPETCGWQYIEGLRQDDDPRIALFWDKAGLNHNGRVPFNGDRTVALISSPHERIPKSKWKEFLAEQRVLLESLPEDRKKLALKSFPVE